MAVYDLNPSAAAYEVDPISRIEGHLGVKVSVNASGFVHDANAHGNMWRGFENFVLGHKPNDPITYMQRICGVCPVPHGMTATYAADTVLGYSNGHITFKGGVTEKAMLIRNLVLSSEFLMSSITHFYHLVAPSYVQGPGIPPWTPYFNDGYYNPLLRGTATGINAPIDGVVPDSNPASMQLWDSVIISYVKALKMRRLTFEAGALWAGRMPMTSCFVAGGVTNDTSDVTDFADRCNKFRSLIQEVGLWIVQEYVPIAFALGLLYVDYDNAGNTGINPDLGVTSGKGYGAGLGRFLAWGAFPETDNSLQTVGGVKDLNASGVADFTVGSKTAVAAVWLNDLSANSIKNVTEDIAHSRYSISDADTAAGSYTGSVAYPGDVQRTKPDRDAGYTYMKAPRWKGWPCEVGPLARLAVASIYPVEGGSLAPIYAPIYALTGGPLGLNPHALSADLLNGLLNTNASGIVAAHPTAAHLVADWLLPGGSFNASGVKGGLSTMDRLRGRALESLILVQRMVGTVAVDASGNLSFGSDGWIDELQTRGGQDSWGVGASLSRQTGTWHGYGATEAPRGALMHQSTIKNNKTSAYQCVVPTTWNGSPKDTLHRNGAIEAAVIGAPFDNLAGSYVSQELDASGNTLPAISTGGGVEVLRIAQSFDPCIACAVH